MYKFANFSEVRQVLRDFIPSSSSSRSEYTLNRMRKLMSYLGSPQNDYKVIHVAGTSGKTSTCYYIASLLSASGKRVGLTVSPHIDEINERTQINMVPLDEKTFCNEFAEFMNLVEKSGIRPIYFELLIAFAMWEFKRQKVEYAVIEVGLGGLLDPSNVIDTPDKLCVITDIGLDHTHVLGKTIEEIAAQKAGIIHDGNTVVAYKQKSEISAALHRSAAQKQAKFIEITSKDVKISATELPLFQRRNLLLSTEVYQLLSERYELKELNESILAKAVNTYIPGRLEFVTKNDRLLLLDVAHNVQKMKALIESLQEMYPGQKYSIVIGLKKAKKSQLDELLEILLPNCSNLIATSFVTAGNEVASLDPQVIAFACQKLSYGKVIVEPKPSLALKRLMGLPGPRIVTGSVFLLNHIRPIISET